MGRDVYQSKNTEKFAIELLSNVVSPEYSTYRWNDKKDDFDFISLDGTKALEVSLIIPENIQNAIKYESSLERGKKPDIRKVECGEVTPEGELVCYYGGSMEEIRTLLLERIAKKDGKARRKQKPSITCYELCLLVSDGGLFHKEGDFDFLVPSTQYRSSIFDCVYIVTSTYLFVIKGRSITMKNR